LERGLIWPGPQRAQSYLPLSVIARPFAVVRVDPS